MKVLSRFIHINVIPNLYDLLSHTQKITFFLCLNRVVLNPIGFYCMDKNTLQITLFMFC